MSLQIYELPRHALAKASWESVENDLAAWIRRLPKPAGVMECSDQRGPQFLEACRRAGVSVPDEVAVIGVDNDEPLCEVCNPPLSSVNPAHSRVGYEAARLLARLMTGKTAPREPVLIQPAGVTTRLSTEVLAIEDRPLAAALRLIREQCCDGLDVAAIARHTGLSRSVLQRRFRTTLKRSVHQEILQARLKRAIDLLAASDVPLRRWPSGPGSSIRNTSARSSRRAPARRRRNFGKNGGDKGRAGWISKVPIGCPVPRRRARPDAILVLRG